MTKPMVDTNDEIFQARGFYKTSLEGPREQRTKNYSRKEEETLEVYASL